MYYLYKRPLRKSENKILDDTPTPCLTLPISIGAGGSGANSQFFSGMVDTGSSRLLVSATLLNKLGIEIKPIDFEVSTLANGQQEKLPLILLDARIKTNTESPTFANVVAAVAMNDPEDTILISQDMLAYYKYTVDKNTIEVFRPDEAKIADLQSATDRRLIEDAELKQRDLKAATMNSKAIAPNLQIKFPKIGKPVPKPYVPAKQPDQPRQTFSPPALTTEKVKIKREF